MQRETERFHALTFVVARIRYEPAGPEGAGCWMVADYSTMEAEYASIRRSAALIEWSQWGIIEVTGSAATDFLDRLVSNALKTIEVGGMQRAFLTNRKGRIEADLTAHRRHNGWWIQTDIACVARVLHDLETMHFGDDVSFCHRGDLTSLGVHGPASIAALKGLGLDVTGVSNESDLSWFRSDWLGVPGVEIIASAARVQWIWDRLVLDESAIRPAGWFAANTARIEAGSPLFAIDFGPENLPSETGVLDSRVSFTKGCYPGQEVVARMKHLGKPKQQLVGLRLEGDELAFAGDPIIVRGADGTDTEVGSLTSSTLSPMLSGSPVAFAMVKTAHTLLGTALAVRTAEQTIPARVGPLCALPGGSR